MRLPALVALLSLAFSVAARADQEEPDSFDLLGYFPTSSASSRIKPFQARISLLYGPLNYASSNASSDAAVDVPGFQRGFRLEADHWFQAGPSRRRTLGISADFQALFVDRFDAPQGPSIRYTSGSLLFGYRFLGYGHSQPWTPEGQLLLGAALESYPTMQLSFDMARYTLATPLVLGGRAGFRFRFPILPRFQMLSLETAGFVTIPMTLMGEAEGTVDKGATRGIGANMALDLRLSGNLVLGVGGYLGWFQLRYAAAGMSVYDRVEFLTTSGLVSLRTAF
ncbi:MAG: hypothetical protein NDJ89_00400 [Oligoflexia bacterium]|nr:hypothetical protein [Oligoflexia bacterium]